MSAPIRKPPTPTVNKTKPARNTLRAPQTVAERAGHQKQRRKRQRVGIHQPFEIGDLGRERRVKSVERDVDHADVEKNDDKPEGRTNKRQIPSDYASERHSMANGRR